MRGPTHAGLCFLCITSLHAGEGSGYSTWLTMSPRNSAAIPYRLSRAAACRASSASISFLAAMKAFSAALLVLGLVVPGLVSRP